MKYLFVIMIWAVVPTCNCVPNPKCEGKAELNYSFNLPINVSPLADTLKLGDTLWIDHSFIEQMQNMLSDKTYQVRNVDFMTEMTIVKLRDGDSLAPVPPSTLYLLADKEGKTEDYPYNTLRDRRRAYKIVHTNADGMYKYKTGMVALETGLYMLNFSSQASNYEEGASVDITDCPREFMQNQYILNNGGGDNNFEMMKHSAGTYYADWSKEEFDENIAYCFYVKD